MGISYSLIVPEQFDSIGSESLVHKLSKCRLQRVSSAYSFLEETRFTSDSQRIDQTTLALALPINVSTAIKLVETLVQADTGVTSVADCFATLLFFCNGRIEDKVQLFYKINGWRPEAAVEGHQIEHRLARLLQCTDRVYEVDPWMKISGNSTEADLLQLARDLVSEVQLQTACMTLRSADLELWLATNMTGFMDNMQYSTTSETSDDIAWNENASNNIIPCTPQPISHMWMKVVCGEDGPSPSNRCKHAVAVSDGFIYVYGGRNGNIPQKDMWRLEIVSNKWERLLCRGDRPNLLQEHTMVAYKSQLFVFGGEFSSSWSKETPLWILNTATLTWKKSAPCLELTVPCSRRAHTAVVVGHQMHIYGGFLDLKGSTSELWTYDMEHAMWHLAYSAALVDDGPGARHSHSAVHHDGAMWVYGGMSDLQPRSDLWKWNFEQCRWWKMKNKNGPPALAGHSACKIPGAMLLYGGEATGVLQADLWQYTFDTQTWQKIVGGGDSPSARSQHTAIVLPSFVLQQAWHAMGSDRSHSVPLLQGEKQNFLSAPATEQQRPGSSPAYQESGSSRHGAKLIIKEHFHKRISPSDQGYDLFINRQDSVQPLIQNCQHDCRTGKLSTHLSSQDENVNRRSPSPSSVVRRLAGCIGQQNKSTDKVEILSSEVYNNQYKTPWQTVDDFNIEERALMLRTNIKRMCGRPIGSNSYARLLSNTSVSSEAGLSIKNPMYSRFDSEEFDSLHWEEGGPIKRPKSQTFSDNFTSSDDSHLLGRERSISVDTIVSMGHNVNLPPPAWLDCRRQHKTDVTHSAMAQALRSASMNSILDQFGGSELQSVDMESEVKAIPMSVFNATDLVIEDLEDCDTDLLMSALSGSSQGTATCDSSDEGQKSNPLSVLSSPAAVAASQQVPSTRVALLESRDLFGNPIIQPEVNSNAPGAQPPVTTRPPPAATPEAGRSISMCTSSGYHSDQSFVMHLDAKYDTAGSPEEVELQNFSKTQPSYSHRATGVRSSAADGLKNYLSNRGMRKCDTVHMFLLGGKGTAPANLEIKPLPMWRLDLSLLVPTHVSRGRPDTRRK